MPAAARITRRLEKKVRHLIIVRGKDSILPFKELPPELIASLYEAALAPEGLTPLARMIGRYLDVESVGLWTTENGGITDITLTGDIVESQKSYLEHYYKLDVWQPDALAQLGQVVIGSDSISDAELQRTEFYNDFARRYGFTNPMGASVFLGEGKSATIALDRLSPRLRFTEADKAPLQILLPHLEYALQLRQRLQPKIRPPQAYGLDALDFGAVICNAQGLVVYANPVAETMARPRKSLLFHAKDKMIGATIATEAQKFVTLVNMAAIAGGAGNMILSDRDGTPTLIVLVTPLPMSVASNIGPGHALIALRPMNAAPPFDAARLMQLFRLSPAQSALAVALYEGKSFEEIATARQVKISTLRTHFAEVLNRTGAKGLRDLTRLLGLIPPLRRASLDVGSRVISGTSVKPAQKKVRSAPRQTGPSREAKT